MMQVALPTAALSTPARVQATPQPHDLAFFNPRPDVPSGQSRSATSDLKCVQHRYYVQTSH